MTPLADMPDRLIVAVTIYGEARGEPVEGQIAVGCVIRNRLKQAINTAPHWRDVCLAPFQFSCFNADDPNFKVLTKLATEALSIVPPKALLQMLWIADGVMSGAANDVTHGADHYLASWLYRTKPPTWASNAPVLATLGHHIFLKVA